MTAFYQYAAPTALANPKARLREQVREGAWVPWFRPYFFLSKGSSTFMNNQTGQPVLADGHYPERKADT